MSVMGQQRAILLAQHVDPGLESGELRRDSGADDLGLGGLRSSDAIAKGITCGRVPEILLEKAGRVVLTRLFKGHLRRYLA